MLKKTILIPLIATPIVAVAIVVPAIVFASSKNQTNNSTENNQNNGNNINQEYITTSGNNMELPAASLSLPTNRQDIENFFNKELDLGKAWIIKNKTILSYGETKFLTSSEQIANILATGDSKDPNKINLLVELKPGSYIDDNGQISQTVKPFHFIIKCA